MATEYQVLVIDDRMSNLKGQEVDGIHFLTRPDLPAAIFTLNHSKPDLVVLSRYADDPEKLHLLREQAERLGLPVINLGEPGESGKALDLIDPDPEDLVSGKLNSLIRELLSSRAMKRDWEDIRDMNMEGLEQSKSLLQGLPLAIWLLDEKGELLYANRPETDLHPLNHPELLNHARFLHQQAVEEAELSFKDSKLQINIDQGHFWQGHPCVRITLKKKKLHPLNTEPVLPERYGWEWFVVEEGVITDSSTGIKLIKGSSDKLIGLKPLDAFPFISARHMDKPLVEAKVISVQDDEPDSPLVQLGEVPASSFGKKGRMFIIRNLEKGNQEGGGVSFNDLVHITSHDLREPVRVILNYGQLVSRIIDKSDDTEAKEFMDYILASGRRMDAYLKQLKQLIQLGQNRMWKPCSFAKVVRDMEAKVLNETNRDFNLVVAKDLPEIKAESRELELLVYNLISNAVKFSEKAPKVSIQCRDLGPNWLFSFEDNGRGIPEGFADSIFDVSKRLELSASPEGAGLGLSICKAIVESANGKIWVDSREGAGTTVSFTWPKEI